MSMPFNRNEEPTKSGKPNVTVQGRVEKIIKSTRPSVPEKAEISIEGADELYREIRIDRKLRLRFRRMKMQQRRTKLGNDGLELMQNSS
jgi:hypothetical protein